MTETHRITWFAPDRPVEGTVYVKPEQSPIRVHSAKGKPAPDWNLERRCKTCGASFLGLAAGKTGERGLWDDMHWYCSAECAPDAT